MSAFAFGAPLLREHLDGWYADLLEPWLAANLPDALLHMGPQGLFWWQWLGLPLVAVLAVVLGVAFAHASVSLLTMIAKRTRPHWDDVLLQRLRGPLALGWMFVIAKLLVPALALHDAADRLLQGVLRIGLLVVFFWGLVRCVDVAASLLSGSSWGRSHGAPGALVELTGRVGKIAVFALGVIAVMSALGYPVASLIAGLGIGGLALALAAQKTVENLFGAFSISVDQPFRPGDSIKVDNIQGTVEAIGLRSTRIRSPDRTLISIPNGKLADMRVESIAARDRIRFNCTLALDYGTKPDQMRSILAELERTLEVHSKIDSDSVAVYFSAMTEAALTIEVTAWLRTPDLDELNALRQELFLSFMQVIEQTGAVFAAPIRTPAPAEPKPA